MPLEVVHPRAHFGEHLGFRLPEWQAQLDPGGPPMSTAAEFCSELSRINLVPAPNADLGRARPGLFKKDGEFLSAHRVERIDRAIGLVTAGSAVRQRCLADR